MRAWITCICLIAPLISACAQTTLNLHGVDKALTPDQALLHSDTQGRIAAWGGVIVHSENLRDQSRIELLAYPLDRRHRPDTEAEPYGRVLIVHPGYLETAVYQAGRRLTASGPVTAPSKGKIGEAAYWYPTLNARQIHLWPTSTSGSQPSVHFGVGVIFH